MDFDTSVRFQILPDGDAVAHTAAAAILAEAQKAIEARGVFRIVLAGGATPLAAYRLLARESADWPAWEIFFGDERCVPVDADDRNDVAARRAWIRRVPIPRDRLHSIPAELGAERAAQAYESEIRTVRPFDLVLLGIGEDGHTASLFAGREIPAGALVIPVHHAPKPPPDRVSLTPKAFEDAGGMLILATGDSKRRAIQAWQNGSDVPVARTALPGRTLVLMDQAAAG
jgi:6-phosphogluconolactonase